MTTTSNISSENLDGNKNNICDLVQECECSYCGKRAEGTGYLGEPTCNDCFRIRQDCKSHEDFLEEIAFIGEEEEQALRIAAEAQADEEFKALADKLSEPLKGWTNIKREQASDNYPDGCSDADVDADYMNKAGRVCEEVNEYGTSKACNPIIDRITDKVITMLEAGQIPWTKPWTLSGVMPTNLVTLKEYRGANAFFLSLYNAEFTSPYYLSFKQAKDLGGSVIKGSKSIPVVFWKWVKDDVEDDDEDARPIVKYYSVFNSEQCTGIEDKIPKTTAQTWNNTPIERGEKIIQDMRDKPKFQNGGKACYTPGTDTITIPEMKYFTHIEEYYSTLFHELTHSTGHKDRLHRLTEHAAFGTAVYSKEELVAEMGAAYCCGLCDITNEHQIHNTAAYIQGWLSKLKNDKRMVIYAAAAAQKAVDFIMNKEAVQQE